MGLKLKRTCKNITYTKKPHIVKIHLYNTFNRYEIKTNELISRSEFNKLIENFAQEKQLVCDFKTRKFFTQKGDEAGVFHIYY